MEPAAQPAERRGATRVLVSFVITLDRLETATIEAEAANISATGMFVRSPIELPLWARFTAALPAGSAREVRVVRRDGNGYGCLFQMPLNAEELEAVLASEEAVAGFDRLRAEGKAPPPKPKGLLRLWRR